MEKVRQPGNLVARKFLKNQALAESFWILLPHFVAIEQFGGNGKEMILVFLQNGHIFHNFQQKLSVCLVFHYYFHWSTPHTPEFSARFACILLINGHILDKYLI